MFRPIVLLFYFEYNHRYLKSLVGSVVEDRYVKFQIRREFTLHMSNDALSQEAKRAIAFAASIIFGRWYVPDAHNNFLENAAKYFWKGLDVAYGETPQENTIARGVGLVWQT